MRARINVFLKGKKKYRMKNRNKEKREEKRAELTRVGGKNSTNKNNEMRDNTADISFRNLKCFWRRRVNGFSML